LIWKNKKQKKSPSETQPDGLATAGARTDSCDGSHDRSHDPSRGAAKKPHRGLILGGIGTLVLLFAALLTLSLIHSGNTRREAKKLDEQASHGQFVEVAEARKSPESREIEIIGEARPFLTDNLYARVSGYVREVNFDKGDRVKKNQVLAVVESPETDRAYLAALADSQNKARIADRMRLLLKRKLVAPQDTEVAIANADIAKATLETQEVLKSYEEVRAPFDGIVTSRLIDPGNLIQNASNSQSAQQLLATMSQVDTLRIYSYVDQKDATFIKVGDPAGISLEELPDLKLTGQVTRVAGELDSRTRKMLTEVDLPNQVRPIVPGSFVKVRIKLQSPSYPELPVKALVVKDKKTFVPLLSMDNTVHFQPIEVLDNDGQTLRVAQGIEPGQRVAIDLGSSVVEGAKVRPQPMAGEMHQTPAYPGAEAGASAQPAKQASGQASDQDAKDSSGAKSGSDKPQGSDQPQGDSPK
jgi:RND family efflux transporter MFP subunit